MADETDTGRLTLTLRKPIEAHGESVKALTFREPSAGDIVRVGNPVKIDPFGGETKIGFDDARMGAMIARLANIPPSSVDRMHPQDFIDASWKLADFFLPGV